MNEFLIMVGSPGSDIQWGKKYRLFFAKTLRNYVRVLYCQTVWKPFYYPGNSVGFNKNFSRNLISSIPDIKMSGSV
jgi:hypothetical protein